MPTAPIMILPKSNSAEEFESICRDVLKSKYDMDFVLHGSKGQKQFGVDLYAESANGSYVVVQCKNYHKCKFNIFCHQICNDIKLSNNWRGKIEKFIVMTALDRDAKVQKFIFGYSAPFPVSVLFWDDIQDELCSNKELLKKYYPLKDDDNELPIKDKNNIIGDAITISKAVKYVFESGSLCSPGYDEAKDIDVYNICVQIYNAVSDLQRKQKEYYLQLNKVEVVNSIDKLAFNLPDFYDENNDNMGTAMLCTILDYKEYFSKEKNVRRYSEWCDKIIRGIKKL